MSVREMSVLYDRVLLSPLPIERSIHVVGKFANYTTDNLGRGRVVACGPDCKGLVEVGDIVWVGKFTGKKVEDRGETYYLFYERELLAREEEDNEYS